MNDPRTDMKRVFSNRWFRLSAGLVLALLIALLPCAWYFRIWSWRDYKIYQAMSQECHPVWQDLHWGHIRAGQDVEDIIEAAKPAYVEHYGEFDRLIYHRGGNGLHFSGVAITAKNGRLASSSAWSCTWERVFFDELTREDLQAFSDAYEAHWQPIRKKLEEAE